MNTVSDLEKIIDLLVAKCGWKMRQIFLFGFSQGAICALHLTLHFQRKGSAFGGCVCASSSILKEFEEQLILEDAIKTKTDSTPIFVTHSARDSVVGLSDARKCVDYLRKHLPDSSKLVFKVYEKSRGHSLLSTEEEAMDVFAFFAANLVRL